MGRQICHTGVCRQEPSGGGDMGKCEDCGVPLVEDDANICEPCMTERVAEVDLVAAFRSQIAPVLRQIGALPHYWR